MVHEVGTPYNDPGAIALDQNDQALTVTISGSVDVFNTGVYELTYSAQDGDGNQGVSQVRQVWVVDENFKYLTFVIVLRIKIC